MLKFSDKLWIFFWLRIKFPNGSNTPCPISIHPWSCGISGMVWWEKLKYVRKMQVDILSIFLINITNYQCKWSLYFCGVDLIRKYRISTVEYFYSLVLEFFLCSSYLSDTTLHTFADFLLYSVQLNMLLMFIDLSFT